MGKLYPRPKATGGQLIRQTIASLKSQRLSLPWSPGRVWVGVSGGSDSVALIFLLAKYGRRIVPKSQLRILHVNHRWRGKESDADEVFVRKLGKTLRVPVTVRRLKAKIPGRSKLSPEAEAREARAQILRTLLKPHDLFLSAHHADDVAETMLWHILTGQWPAKGEGILFQTGQTLRPFLGVRKKTLQAFLQEEGMSWQEDRTNQQGQLLRTRIRRDVSPALNMLFPRWVEHLGALARRGSGKPRMHPQAKSPPIEALLKNLKYHLRRPHFEALAQARREIHLPGGSRLQQEIIRSKTTVIRRWILEEFLPKADKEP